MCSTQRDGSLAAGLLRLRGVCSDVSDDREQPDSDGLEALASGLKANEADEPDEDLDLASLAAVTGARATSPSEQKVPEAAAPKASGMHAAPVPGGGRNVLVPALLVFAVAVGVGGYVLGRSASPSDPVDAPAAPVPSVGSPTAVPAEPLKVPAPAEPPAPSASPALAATEPAPPNEALRARAAPRGATPPKHAAPGAVAAPVTPSPPPAPVPPATEVVASPQVAKPGEPQAALAKTGPAAGRSMDQLLDDALSGSALPIAAAAAPTPDAPPAALPEAPTREEVTQAMAVLLPAIRGCAMGQTGLATAGIVVRGDGRVASVELTGAPFEGTASGRCMEGVLRRARFSRFRQATFRVRFPFAIQ